MVAPVRGRGLKRGNGYKFLSNYYGRPRAGAWIETRRKTA